jgi:hypothetical protein
MKRTLALVVVSSLVVAWSAGCGSKNQRDEFDQNGTDPNGGGPNGNNGAFGGDASVDGSGGDDGRDPETCDEAKASRSYVGCDYWPTVTANNVWSIFDYAVVVSNTSKADADVKVTGPNGANVNVTVASGALEKIYLPWQADLKGPDSNATGQAAPLTASVVSKGGAYHLVSTVPVVVYQFNPLEYKGQGGPSGKSWANCPTPPGATGCFSYSNDASLLLPSTAWTGNYRVTAPKGWTSHTAGVDVMGGYVVVTAAQDGTNLTIALSPGGQIIAGGGIAQTNGGGVVKTQMNAGDAIELVTPVGDKYDLSGSLVQADKPVQVITGIPCINIPPDNSACDHVEESVVPAEALGKKYLVATPTAPKGGPGQHVVRFVGNRDGTTLTYTPGAPGCPPTLNAGQVAECGPLSIDFLVEGTNEFALSSYMVGSSVYDPIGFDPRGDPSETTYGSTEQARISYLFLAPDDYDVNYAVVTGPSAANPQIDGAPLSGFTNVGGGLGVWRVKLGEGKSGAHRLTSDQGVGLQVMGYGSYTSYQYPGGLNLKQIAPPPPAVK